MAMHASNREDENSIVVYAEKPGRSVREGKKATFQVWGRVTAQEPACGSYES